MENFNSPVTILDVATFAKLAGKPLSNVHQSNIPHIYDANDHYRSLSEQSHNMTDAHIVDSYNSKNNGKVNKTALLNGNI